MVDPIGDEERASFTRKLKLGVTVLVGLSAGLVAAQADGEPVLTLAHPDGRIGGRLRLSVPGDVAVSGSVTSTSPSWIRAVGTDEGGIRVTLGDSDHATRVTLGDGESTTRITLDDGATAEAER